MKNKRATLLGMLLFVTIALLAAPALAVLTTDSTNIGAHPNYSGMSSFWRTGNDYSVLTDGNNLFFNASNSFSTGIMFRFANAGGISGGVTDPTGFPSAMYLDNAANLHLGGEIIAGSGVGATFYNQLGSSTNNFGGTINMTGPSTTLTLSGSGMQAFKPGGGPWSTLSDIRTKKNELAYSTGLSVIREIHPVSYQYNGMGGSPAGDYRYVGVNAQDLEPVAPSMVGTLPSDLPGGTKYVDPNEFTFMLINAVQELDAKVRDLETRCR